MIPQIAKRDITLYERTTQRNRLYLTQGSARTIVATSVPSEGRLRLQTTAPHLFSIGEWVKLSGFSSPELNKPYPIEAVPSKQTFEINSLIPVEEESAPVGFKSLQLFGIKFGGAITQQNPLTRKSVPASGSIGNFQVIVPFSTPVKVGDELSLPKAGLPTVRVTGIQIVSSTRLRLVLNRRLLQSVSEEPLFLPLTPEALLSFEVGNTISGEVRYYLSLSEWENISLNPNGRNNYYYQINYQVSDSIFPLIFGKVSMIPNVTEDF